jgi:hypothetical protein
MMKISFIEGYIYMKKTAFILPLLMLVALSIALVFSLGQQSVTGWRPQTNFALVSTMTVYLLYFNQFYKEGIRSGIRRFVRRKIPT